MEENDIKLGEYVFYPPDKESWVIIKIYEDEKTNEIIYDLDDRDNFIMKGIKRDQIKKISKREW